MVITIAALAADAVAVDLADVAAVVDLEAAVVSIVVSKKKLQ